jgi:hypothetical protein
MRCRFAASLDFSALLQGMGHAAWPALNRWTGRVKPPWEAECEPAMFPIMSKYLHAAQRLHHFLHENFWDGELLIGPDQGVRFNRRFWRFVKSYLAFLPWADNCYYLQAQEYWVLGNWQLYDLIGEQQMADMAIKCAYGILKAQQPNDHWGYPHPGWAGRIATVEVVGAALGMLASYERAKEPPLLEGVIKAYDFLINHTGFQKADSGFAINYFANRRGGLVPNNTTLALAFFGRLAQVTGDERYLTHCPEMLAFLASVQLGTGEFPYVIESPLGKGHPHFQCYQYNAFELQDLAMYYEATQDGTVLPLITKLAQFLSPSVKEDGSTRFDCADSGAQIIYNTAAIAAALGIARRMGLYSALEAENRAYAYVLSQQHSNGGFAFSRREHGFLKDKRYYPRPMTMILYHLLLRASEIWVEAQADQGVAV